MPLDKGRGTVGVHNIKHGESKLQALADPAAHQGSEELSSFGFVRQPGRPGVLSRFAMSL